MYQEIHTENIAERAHAPEAASLLASFDALAEAGRGAPHEALIQAVMAEHREDLMVLSPTGDGEYTYIHFGREIIRYVGGDRCGQNTSYMRDPVARFTRSCFDKALGNGAPIYTVHRSLDTVRVCLWERLIMPTTAAGGERFLVVFSRPLQFREELLTTVLDTSPSGIIALRCIRDDEGNIERAVIITANTRAAIMAGLEGDTLLDKDARSSLPFLADETTWRRCLYAIELRRSDMFETCVASDGAELWLKVSLAPLGDGLVMTLTDISELMLANMALRSRAATLALEIGRERATRRALSVEIDQREEREKELRRLAETDPLTALLNRRSFTEKATLELNACAEIGADAALIIVDLDHFKSINDSHGHAAGDAVIRAFADLLLGMVRGERDLVGRIGGEEFVMLIPRVGTERALAISRRIIDALALRRLPVTETLSLQVSASLGVALREPGETLNDFIARADRALYRAKNEGRNCIRLAPARARAVA